MTPLDFPLGWQPRRVLSGRCEPQRLHEAFGLPHKHAEDYWTGAVADFWAFGCGCGLKLALELSADLLIVHADVYDPEHLRHHLSALEGLEPAEAPEGQGEAGWELWRQDDNGGEFFIARFVTEVGARCVENAFEARGHKQGYWVREV